MIGGVSFCFLARLHHHCVTAESSGPPVEEGARCSSEVGVLWMRRIVSRYLQYYIADTIIFPSVCAVAFFLLPSILLFVCNLCSKYGV